MKLVDLIRYDSEGNITDEYYYFNGKFHRKTSLLVYQN